MIDFVSTREGVDPDIRASARLVAHLIARMLRDASRSIGPEEAFEGRNHDPDARAALDYLFDAASDTFDDHLRAIGGNAAVTRAALLGDRPLPQRGSFTETTRRVIQTRYGWWCAERSCNRTEGQL